MSMMNPRSVRSREELAEFVRGLAVDLKRHPDQWTNVSLGDFLESMSAWIDDMDGYHKSQGEEVPSRPQWRTLAEILAASRMYE